MRATALPVSRLRHGQTSLHHWGCSCTLYKAMLLSEPVFPQDARLSWQLPHNGASV